ncbi:MAG: response regulator [Myxococcales bacterium]
MTQARVQRIVEAQPRGVVLLVEDSELESMALVDALEVLGFSVVACEDGAGALERLRSGLMPSLILLDLHTPRMSGWEFRLAQRDHEGWRKIPVIAMSGDRSAQAMAIDADRYLAKPFQRATLQEAIESVLADTQLEASRSGEASRTAGGAGFGFMAQRSLEVLHDSLTLARSVAQTLHKKLPQSDAFGMVGIVQLLARAHGASLHLQALVQGERVQALAVEPLNMPGRDDLH